MCLACVTELLQPEVNLLKLGSTGKLWQWKAVIGSSGKACVESLPTH